MEAVALQLPPTKRWSENGRLVAQALRVLRESFGDLDMKSKRRAVILAGHSFGGSAVTIAAAAKRETVNGLILLDPAWYEDPVLRKAAPSVRAPTMILGADETIFRARGRGRFYAQLAGKNRELSVRGATHDDAQSPSMYALGAYGIDPFTSPVRQARFTAGLTAAALSVAATGKFDWAYQFLRTRSQGTMILPRRRG